MNSQFSEFHFFNQLISNLKIKERSSLSSNPLSKHLIDPHLRSRMINWMVEVCCKFEFSPKVYFLSVRILDKYLQLSNSQLLSSEIHMIGVTCMFIANKFEDVTHFSLKVFITQIARGKFSDEDMKKLEQDIVCTLFFELDLVVCTDFLTLICRIYEIPENVQKTAENFLFSIQIIDNLQLLPSDEAVIAICFASSMHQVLLNQEIVALFAGVDFGCKFKVFKNNFIRNRDVLKRMANPQIYRKFEIDDFYCLLQGEGH